MLKNALSLDQKLCRVYELRERLYDIFYSNVHADRLEAVNKWCIQAKASNEKSLNSFALWLEEKFLRTEY